MTRARSSPPRLAQAIVRSVTPDPRWREVLLGDLGEEFAALVGARVAEIALALPLLIISTLAAVGAHRFVSGPQDYDPADLYRVRITLPEARYKNADDQRRFVERLLEETRTLPGVQHVGTANITPSTSANESRVLAIEGHEPQKGDEQSVNFRAVSPDYLQTMRIPVLQGRGLEESDREHTRAVAVISQSMARLYNVSTTDPIALGTAAVGVIVVALLSGAIPARRLSRVDPVTTLRAE